MVACAFVVNSGDVQSKPNEVPALSASTVDAKLGRLATVRKDQPGLECLVQKVRSFLDTEHYSMVVSCALPVHR